MELACESKVHVREVGILFSFRFTLCSTERTSKNWRSIKFLRLLLVTFHSIQMSVSIAISRCTRLNFSISKAIFAIFLCSLQPTMLLRAEKRDWKILQQSATMCIKGSENLAAVNYSIFFRLRHDAIDQTGSATRRFVIIRAFCAFYEKVLLLNDTFNFFFILFPTLLLSRENLICPEVAWSSDGTCTCIMSNTEGWN